MKLQQLIEQGYQKDNDLNCAETILKGANEAYELGLDEHALRLSAGFGGGMGVENACGVVTGMAMVLSALYAKDRGHNSPEMKEKIQTAIAKYQTIYQSINCRYLKEHYRDGESGCHQLIVAGGKILDDMTGTN